MAEHEEPQETEAGEAAAPAADSGLAAVALALAATNAKPDPALSAFLEQQAGLAASQRRLAEVQLEDLHEQRELSVSRLRLGLFSDRMKALLQVMTAAVGLAVFLFVAAMAWRAHEDHGLTIAAFSVPPDLAQTGLTGPVVAARVRDRLSELQAQTVSARPASTYADNWGDDIKVEIPETGVSIGEIGRYLREALGHETRVSGEVVRAGAALSITARAETEPGQTFAGPPGDFDKTLSLAAEDIYSKTQPYRYAAFLSAHGQVERALAIYAQLAREGSPEDQRWAYAGWSSALILRGDEDMAAAVVRQGMARGLDLYDTGAINFLGVAAASLANYQNELESGRLVAKGARRTNRGFGGLSAAQARRNTEAVIALTLGDARTAAAIWGASGDVNLEGDAGALQTRPLASAELIEDHDVAAGVRLIAPNTAVRNFSPGANQMRAARQLEDWPRFVALTEQELARARANQPRERHIVERWYAAALAVGYAKTGRQADAEAVVAPTPMDCEVCLDARAQVAAAKGDWTGAAAWYARLDRQAPEIPFYDTHWGEMLLAKGDVDGAIAKLKLAAQKGPHFADPLELWGEALLRKGNVAGAIRKFQAADQYAPRWGRNHLRWGQALARLGQAVEAQGQYRAAAKMDLSAADLAAVRALLGKS